MANWSKHIEDITGLPVFKRAKHGIHFQRPDGQIEASFSGKPCHHFADGIWKPIDTKLILLPDGFYGCPHSPVRVHPDGRVAVTGSSYVQRVELPSAKTGLADGDKLIREFSFGKQEMRITEDGFKSEITLNRIPTLTEARKLIASESGTLSKKYLKNLTTATDANGKIHTYSTLTAFRTWLSTATFPIVIDPDFSAEVTPFYSVAGFSEVSFLDARATADTTLNYLIVGTAYEDEEHIVLRGFMKFDTSSIDDNNVVDSSELTMTLNGHSVSDDYDIELVKQTWGDEDPIESLYDDCLSGDIDKVFCHIDSETVALSTFNTKGLSASWINKSGYTHYSLRTSDDVAGTTPDYGDNGGNYAEFNTNKVDFPELFPFLTVTYSAGGSITPIVQYYNRLRRN